MISVQATACTENQWFALRAHPAGSAFPIVPMQPCPASASFSSPVGAPHQNTAVWFITATLNKQLNYVRDGLSILLGGVKKFSGGLGIAAVILKTLPGHPTGHRASTHFDPELGDIRPANPYPSRVVSELDLWHFVSSACTERNPFPHPLDLTLIQADFRMRGIAA